MNERVKHFCCDCEVILAPPTPAEPAGEKLHVHAVTRDGVFEGEMACTSAGCRLEPPAVEAGARERRLEAALRAGVKLMADFRSYYITDNRLGLDPSSNAEVFRADTWLREARAALQEKDGL